MATLYLIAASFGGHTEIVKLLIYSGADVNISENVFGQTALMVSSMNGFIEVVSFLIYAGANVNAKDNFGITALRSASNNGHSQIVNMLRSAGAMWYLVLQSFAYNKWGFHLLIKEFNLWKINYRLF